jgi:hypothetical protein
MLPRKGHRIPLLLVGEGLLLGSKGAAELANLSESKNEATFPCWEPEKADPSRCESDLPKPLEDPGSEEFSTPWTARICRWYESTGWRIIGRGSFVLCSA